MKHHHFTYQGEAWSISSRWQGDKGEYNTYSEELLSSRDNVSNDNCCAERIDDVLVVGMQGESVNDLAYTSKQIVESISVAGQRNMIVVLR
jgi:hypothetical protein